MKPPTAHHPLQAGRNRLRAAGAALDNMVMTPAGPTEPTWAAVFLILLAYFMFQSTFAAMGYEPFGGAAAPSYVYRTLLAVFLFFGGVLWLLPARFRDPLGSVGLTFFLLATAWAVIVEVADLPDIAAASDRSEALSAGLDALLAGRYPYLEQTHLGNPLSPLTVSLLLALPTHLAFGRPELTNLPMFVAVFAMIVFQHRRARCPIALPIVLALWGLNPVLIWDLAWGSDLTWGMTLLLGAMMALDSGRLRLAGVLFGLTLATRLSFFLLVPMWALFLIRREGRPAWIPMLLGGVVAGALIMPFMLWRSDVFFHQAPLGLASSKFGLPLPGGDNLVADMLKLVLPTGPERSRWITGGLILFSAALGWFRARDVTQLAFGTSLLFALALFFMGPFFLRSYLIWVLYPLLFALLGNARRQTHCPK